MNKTKSIENKNEGKKCPVLGDFLYKLYGVAPKSVRKTILSAIWRTENSFHSSVTIRRIFSTYYDVHIGMYTFGGCFIPGAMDKQTTIGRYSSFANPVTVLNTDHPMDWISTHAFFFNPSLKICKKYLASPGSLEIGNDVWLGRYSIIKPNVSVIGDGAIVGAGSVIHKDIPPYAVVVGNPARTVGFRFSKEIINELLESKWWEKSIDEIKLVLHKYQQPYKNLTPYH